MSNTTKTQDTIGYNLNFGALQGNTVITILFDIVGTLIRSGGAGMLAIQHVIKQMFDIERIGSVQVHGRTDNGILNDLFSQLELSFDEHRSEFNDRYWDKLPETLRNCAGSVLPGVENLLAELKQNDDVALGVLTGNSKRAAEIKLRHFELDDYFEFGGYGDVHSDRNDVASMARLSAESRLASTFEPDRLWVVGDTVNDIVCARSINSRVVAVETGGGDIKKLASAQPDVLFSSLDDTAAFMRAVVWQKETHSDFEIRENGPPPATRTR